MGGAVLLGSVIAYYILCRVLPSGSIAQTGVSDFAFVAVELAALGLAFFALRRTAESRGRWVWALVIGWLVLNIVGDTIWGLYEVAGTPPPRAWPTGSTCPATRSASRRCCLPPGRLPGACA